MPYLLTCGTSCAPAVAEEAFAALMAREGLDLPLGIYANGSGAPDDDTGWTFLGGVGRSAWVAAARESVLRGARLIGGCCGTSPDWIATLREELTQLFLEEFEALAEELTDLGEYVVNVRLVVKMRRARAAMFDTPHQLLQRDALLAPETPERGRELLPVVQLELPDRPAQ